MMENLCLLCETPLSRYPILDGEKRFCCTGCHSVFTILSTKNQLDNFQETAVFQQAFRAGIISNPTLLEKIRQKQITISEHELKKLNLEIGDMWCPACAEVIKLILLQEKGVRHCVVDYATDMASIEYTPHYISRERLMQLIRLLGYNPQMLDQARKAISFSLYLRFAVAAFCSLNIMMLAYPLYATYFHADYQKYGPLLAWLSGILVLPVLCYSAWPIFRRCFASLLVGLYGMEMLIVLGIIAAFGLSAYELAQGGTHVYFDSMSVIVTFVLLGKMIEAKAKFSAKDSLQRLMGALPRRARKRLADGSQLFVPVKDIHPGDTIVVFSGEKIVLDGVVCEGEGMCDESLMTGEALPVFKTAGFQLLGGTILQNGMIAFNASARVEESALSKIVEMVQQEIGQKSLYVRAADRIIHWFVPLVSAIALGIATFCWLFDIADVGKTVLETAITRAVSVLLISCPCAIGIAAPLAESHLINALAHVGAIVRNRGCLSLLGKETAFVFDKTGTITKGSFTLQHGLEHLSLSERAVLKGLTAQSAHPIASALFQSIEGPLQILNHVEEIAGKGLIGYFDGASWLLGSALFMRQHGINLPMGHIGSAATQVYFAGKGHYLATLRLQDTLKESAKEMVASLEPANTILLSGDASQAVEAVAQSCGFRSWHAECTPLQKRLFIESLRKEGGIVCMLGDGINDAPALTAAHVGISVLSATDISIQVSDILLTTDRLMVIPKIRALALKGHAIIKQNLFWAFFYNVIGIGLAMAGWLSPIFAAFAMTSSSLMVLFNAKRIK